MTDIRVMFVLSDDLKDESEAVDQMTEAYEACKELVKNITWIRESELNEKEFSKLDYLIFDRFEGKDFSKFVESKCAVLGPLAIKACLTESKPIPSYQWPIWNVAMYDCQVTCSQLSKSEKEDLSEKVRLMGGLYMSTFTETTTHLVCNGTKSEKYMLAAEKGVKLLTPEWINYLFDSSKTEDVKANDPDILEKFRCPPFYNLTICSTGISSSRERAKLAEVVAANGGTLAMKLVISKTDILICHGATGTSSDKFKAARNTSHIACLTADWIFDSIRAGHALPHEKYRINTTSTPTKEGENVDPNFSTISAIGVSLRKVDTIDATTTDNTTMPRNSNKRKADEDLVENIDIKKVKSAGTFLDGCSVFVAGFNTTAREKLNKIINISGATRYDSFSERVTHVIVGDPNCEEMKSLGLNCCLVNVKWLLDSVEQQKPADEEKYLFHTASAQTNLESPLSKNILNFVTTANSQRDIDDDEVTLADEPEDTLARRYLQKACSIEDREDTLAELTHNKNNQEEFTIKSRILHRTAQNESMPSFRPADTSTQISSITSETEVEVLPIFKSCKLYLDRLDPENMDIYKKFISDAQGAVVQKRFKGICDFAIFPVVYKPANSSVEAQEVFNELWLMQCIEDNALCEDVQYYHRPVELPVTVPLEGCVITISGYTNYERKFLRGIIEGLGGLSQEMFSRKNCEAKRVLASTHLISPEASGKKYEAAVKWNLPVATREWLTECAKTGKRVAIEKFLIGDSRPTESLEAYSVNMSTPKAQKLTESSAKTPANHRLGRGKNTPEAFSQVTPVNKILQDAIDNKILPTPPSPETEFPWSVKTPDTPIGAFIRPDPSPRLRKEMQKYVNSFPDFVPPQRRNSTPLSELRKRLVDKVLAFGSHESQDPATPKRTNLNNYCEELNTENLAIHEKLQELQQRVMASGGSSGTKRVSRLFEASSTVSGESGNIEAQSQACTVGWDYGEEKFHHGPKVFMFSGIEMAARDRMAKDLKQLGASISSLASYDPSATHLICPKPGRNEKSLACMAAGKWILHASYVEKSIEAGRLLDEEEFEFGNPKAKSNVFYEDKDTCIHFWRKEIGRRRYGAFNDLRAIVVAEKRDPIVTVIEAGGGAVVNVRPPFDDPVHATHCLLEIKMIKDFSEYLPLARQGVKCVNTIYINDFLWRIKKDDNDYIIPYFAKYYK